MCNTCNSYYGTNIYAPVACSTLSEINENKDNTSALYFTIQNPVNDEALLRFSKITEQSCKIVISNVLGQNFISKELNLNQENISINTSEIPSGIYLVSVFNNSNSFTRRMVKL